MAAAKINNLSLTDFMDLQTLQEIQDSFAAIANVQASITDRDGNVITSSTPSSDFLKRQEVLAESVDGDRPTPADMPQKQGKNYVAPIMVNNQRLGTLRMSPESAGPGIDDAKLKHLADKYGLEFAQMKALALQLVRNNKSRPASIQFLFLLANAIARLCYQEFQLRQRIKELTAVYNVTSMLAESRDLTSVLRRTAELVSEVMGTKAASIRLIDTATDELVTKAIHNLSPEYQNKGAIRLAQSTVDRMALSPRGYDTVLNMATDPRILYPEESKREGVISLLSAGMRYKGKPIGVIRVYTDIERAFTNFEIDLLKAIAAQAAAAIENTRLLEETIAAEALEKQVKMAADVQQRMVPRQPPMFPGVDLASIYEPCFELGGDFFDFIPLGDHNMGLVVADVSGKGVPASLIMASVRAYLRAEVDNIYYLYEIMRRLNLMLYRDTKPSEFVTALYGVLDTRTRRFTYCNAGHPPALLLRNGEIMEMGVTNMVLGVDPQESYTQSVMELEQGDIFLMYTDGLPDAMNFNGEMFGRQRIIESFAKGGATAEAVAQNLLWDMRRFVGLARRTDDVTMIVARLT